MFDFRHLVSSLFVAFFFLCAAQVMAKDTAKKNLRSNEARMKLFWQITAGINAIYLISIAFFGDLWWGSILGWLFWVCQEYLALKLLAARGSPELSETGEILDCIDLSDHNQLGIYTYAQDLLWVCWVSHSLCAVSSYFLVLYLPVPFVALKKAWEFVISPLLSRMTQSKAPTPEPQEDDVRSRLQRRREQLRARKGKATKE